MRRHPEWVNLQKIKEKRFSKQESPEKLRSFFPYFSAESEGNELSSPYPVIINHLIVLIFLLVTL